MAASARPEIGVKITASTSGLSAGFDEAVRATEKGVAAINGAMSKLESSQVLAEQWTRKRAAAEREAYAVSATMAAAQTRVAAAMNVASGAAQVSAVRYAQAAQKSLLMVDALGRVTTSGGSAAAKMIGLGTTAATVFGPGGIAFAAVAAFGAMFIGQMQSTRDEIEETERKFTESIREMINAGDIQRLTKMAQDLFVGTPAEKFADGIAGIRRRLAELGPLENVPVLGAANVEKRREIGELTEKLKGLESQLGTLRQAVLDTANVPQLFGPAAITFTAERDKPAQKPKDRAAEEVRDRMALFEAMYAREQALAGEDYSKKMQLASDHLNALAEIYGAQSAEYVRALTEIETAEREHAQRLEDQRREGIERWQELMAENAALQLEWRNEYQDGWEQALARVSSAFERAYSGIFAGTKSLGDAFRDMGRILLESMAMNVAKSLQIWIAAELTKRLYGAATAKQTVANSAVEAAAKAWSATAGIPIVGPLLAPFAAAGAFAGVLAFGSSIKSAAGGWGNIPEDQVAMVHKNEMILPAPIADGVRKMTESGAVGGGGNVSFNVTTMDGRSFNDFLRRNGGPMADAIRELMRSGQLTLTPN